MVFSISRSVLERILAHAAAAPEREICGLLLGEGDAIADYRPARNISPDQGDSFELDPNILFDQMRAEREGGQRQIGHYHSHPNGQAEPSRRDADAVADPRQLWMIVAGGVATLWRADAPDGLHGCFERVDLRLE